MKRSHDRVLCVVGSGLGRVDHFLRLDFPLLGSQVRFRSAGLVNMSFGRIGQRVSRLKRAAHEVAGCVLSGGSCDDDSLRDAEPRRCGITRCLAGLCASYFFESEFGHSAKEGHVIRIRSFAVRSPSSVAGWRPSVLAVSCRSWHSSCRAVCWLKAGRWQRLP